MASSQACSNVFDDFFENADEKTRQKIMQTYMDISGAVPDTLFCAYRAPRIGRHDDDERDPSKDAAFALFDGNPELRSLSARTKRLIYIDVPKTLAEFSGKSFAVEEFLKDGNMYSSALLVLCRILCTTCKLFSAEYKQGMNYAAAAVLINCVMSKSSTVQPSPPDSSAVSVFTACFSDLGSTDVERYISYEKELKSCIAVCYLLSSDSLLALLKGSGQLFAQVKRFEYVVSRCPQTSRVANHLESLGTNLDFLSQQWLSTCFTVGVPHELTIFVHSAILSSTEEEVFLRIGMSILAVLQASILMLKDTSSVINEIRMMVRSVRTDDILYFFHQCRINVDSPGMMEYIQPPGTIQVPITFRDEMEADDELTVLRSLYRRHTSPEWMGQNIDVDFREQISTLYCSLATAKVPVDGIFTANGAKLTQSTSGPADAWCEVDNDDLSTWDVKDIPPVSIGDDRCPPSAALMDFINRPELSDLLTRTKLGIIDDVPQTFVEFEEKSDVISQYLKTNRQSVESALCRILCVSCKLLRVGYTRGMNHLAGSVLLNCVCESEAEETGIMLEVKACQLYCYLLSSRAVGDWFRESKTLSTELKKLEFVLLRHVPSALATQYLLAFGCPTAVWATEWFKTCCAVGAPREVALLVQSKLFSGDSIDIIFRVGAAMMSLLQDRILHLQGNCNIAQELSGMLRNVDNEEVLRMALRYRLCENIESLMKDREASLSCNSSIGSSSIPSMTYSACVIS